MLLECRGVDSTSVPAAQLIRRDVLDRERRRALPGLVVRSFPPWRSTATRRRPTAPGGRRPPAPACRRTASPRRDEHWVPFVGADGKVFEGGTERLRRAWRRRRRTSAAARCRATRPTASPTRDGTGDAEFDVWTAEDNASLGCSPTVACSLVVIPIMGISCDADARRAARRRPAPAGRGRGRRRRCRADGVLLRPAVRARANRPAGRARPRRQRCAVVGGVELAQPDLGAADLRAARERLRRGRQDRRRRHLRLGADDPGDAAVGAALLPGHEALPLQARPDRRARGAQPVRRGSVDGGVRQRPAGPTATRRPSCTRRPRVTASPSRSPSTTPQGRPYRKLKLTPRLLAKLLTESYPAIDAVEAGRTQPLSQQPARTSRSTPSSCAQPGDHAGCRGSARARPRCCRSSSDSDVITR